VAISFVLVLVGLFQAMLQPQPLIVPSPAPGEIASGIRAGSPAATVMAGLLVLMLTPFARVLVLGFEFARQREGPFVAISIVVLLLLITSIVIGMQ
jgi:uncharacterized membrane protein